MNLQGIPSSLLAERKNKIPSRMIHYLIAEKVAEQVEIKDRNRFKIGSLWSACENIGNIEKSASVVACFLAFPSKKRTFIAKLVEVLLEHMCLHLVP